MGQYLVRRTHHPALAILRPKYPECFVLESPMVHLELVVVVVVVIVAPFMAALVGPLVAVVVGP